MLKSQDTCELNAPNCDAIGQFTCGKNSIPGFANRYPWKWRTPRSKRTAISAMVSTPSATIFNRPELAGVQDALDDRTADAVDVDIANEGHV